MKVTFFRFRHFPLLLVCLAANRIVNAADPRVGEAPTPQVLEQVIVQDDGRQVLMQRLDRAPVLPATSGLNQTVAVTSSPEGQSPEKPHHLLFLSCTVYDNLISVINWSVQGRQYRAYANVDFNDLAGIGSFKSADAIYSLFAAIGNDTSESIDVLNADLQNAGYPANALIQLPALDSFPAGQSSYVLAWEPADQAHVEADCNRIEALLTYFDANKLALQQARQERELARLQREQYLKDHPPQPKDTVLQFWPIKSQRYPVSSQGGQQ